jgi:hypothetical protein
VWWSEGLYSLITREKARVRVLIFPVPACCCPHRALTGAELPAGGLSARQSITLLQELMAVPDPRHRRGRRHSWSGRT